MDKCPSKRQHLPIGGRQQEDQLFLRKPFVLHCLELPSTIQHDGDGYFGGSLVHSTFLMYSPDGINVKRWGAEGRVESCKKGTLTILLFRLFCYIGCII